MSSYKVIAKSAIEIVAEFGPYATLEDAKADAQELADKMEDREEVDVYVLPPEAQEEMGIEGPVPALEDAELVHYGPELLEPEFVIEEGGFPEAPYRNPEQWLQEADEEIEDAGTEGAFTKQARRAGYKNTMQFARAVMKGWRSGKKTVLNKKTRKQQGITKKTMNRANFAINAQKRRRNPKLVFDAPPYGDPGPDDGMPYPEFHRELSWTQRELLRRIIFKARNEVEFYPDKPQSAVQWVWEADPYVRLGEDGYELQSDYDEVEPFAVRKVRDAWRDYPPPGPSRESPERSRRNPEGRAGYNVYDQHKGANTRFPTMSIVEARQLAESAAARGHDSFFRVFERLPGGRQQFVVAFGVLDGKVTEYPPSIERPGGPFPKQHWNPTISQDHDGPVPRAEPGHKTRSIVTGDQTADPRERAYINQKYTTFLGSQIFSPGEGFDYWGDPESGHTISVGIGGHGSSSFGPRHHFRDYRDRWAPDVHFTEAGRKWNPEGNPKRLVDTLRDSMGEPAVKIYRDSEWDQFVVVPLSSRGERVEGAEYYADDLEDARQTAVQMRDHRSRLGNC